MPYIFRMVALGCVVAAAGSCKTVGKHDAGEPVPEPAALQQEFTPVTFISPIHFHGGSYPELFAPESVAIWSGPELAPLRRRQDEAAGQKVDEKLAAAAAKIHESFLIFECSLVSAFGDMSIGYDAVRLRGISVYLALPDGRRIEAAQIYTGRLREEQRAALRQFSRTCILVFPKRDFVTQKDVAGVSPAMRLILEKGNTVFYFEWQSSTAPVPSWLEQQAEYAKAIKVGFVELYGTLLRAAHVFD